MPAAKKTSSKKASKTPEKASAKISELPNDWCYEDTLARVEDITGQLETGDLSLADIFEQFSEAVIALQQCDQFLQAKQVEATLLIETLVDGENSA